MKFNNLMVLMFSALAAIFAAGCGNKEIDLVKNGFLNFDKTKTVASVLDAQMDDVSWKMVKDDSGQEFVEATGKWRIDAYDSFISSIKALDSRLDHVTATVDVRIRTTELARKLRKEKGESNSYSDGTYRIESEKLSYCKATCDGVRSRFQGHKKVIHCICLFPQKGDIVKLRFKTDKDNTFQFAYGEVLTVDKKIKMYANKYPANTDTINPEYFIKLIYRTEDTDPKTDMATLATINQQLNTVESVLKSSDSERLNDILYGL